MTAFAPIAGLLGGALIGIAAVLLMAGIGRIAGVSGIVLAAMVAPGRAWRWAFVVGLPLGALLVGALGLKDWSTVTFPASLPITALAGLAVGAGAILGSGCTSGHGICGLARLSVRSLVATATFMAVAVATVFVARHLIG